MNSKGDDDQQFTIEKFRSTYTDITVKDCPPLSKVSVVPTTTSVSVTTIPAPPPSNKIPSHPLSIVTCSGNQKIETTHSELKQVAENRLPPYTNVNVGHNQVRVTKTKPRPVQKTPSIVEKTFSAVISESAILSPVTTSNKIITSKANVSLNLLPRTEKLNQISITQNKQVEKTPCGNTVADDRNTSSPIHKNIQDQITQLQSNRSCDVIEKNIQTKVLTVTPCSTAQKTTAVSPPTLTVSAKDTKNNPGSVSKTISSAVSLLKNNTSPKEQLKQFPTKSSTCVRPNDSNVKNGSSKVTVANNIALSTVLNTDVSRHLLSKSRITVTSSSDAVKTPVKNDSEISKNIPVRQIQTPISRCPKVSSTVSFNPALETQTALPVSQIPRETVQVTASQVQTVSVQTLPIQTVPVQTISVATLPTSISNNRCLTVTLTENRLQHLVDNGIQLSSLTEIESNKELLEVLNAGTNVPVTENLTISKQHMPISVPIIPVVLQSVSDTKIRNVSSETTIQSIQNKQINNPNAPTTGAPRKIVNVTEAASSHVGNTSQSPPQELNIISSPLPSDCNSPKHDISMTVLNTSDESDSRKRQDEPECLTISSDEETDEFDHVMSSSIPDHNEVSVSIMNKEPLIEKSEVLGGRTDTADGQTYEQPEESALDRVNGDEYINLLCRTVRIGSYKVTPRSAVVLSPYGLRIVIPPTNINSENIVLKIPFQEIRKVLIHFGKSLPVIFYYVSPQIGAKVRSSLNLNEGSEAYFDPTSDDESQKRITLLPEKFTELDKMAIKGLYKPDVLAELNHKEANELLVRSAPREVRRRVQRVMKQVPPNPVQTIMVFPPPPAKGGISINTEDYSCLAEDVFLNDVIIDFYLKYLYLQVLSEEDRQKTHIFSSFFYKRLTDKATPIPRNLQNSRSGSGDGIITAAEIRHSRVKNWTKNIDIFSKDYIIIPLNENQHWFLAIICFPGLRGPVRFCDNSPIDVQSKEMKDEAAVESSSLSDSASKTITIGSTTITPLRNEKPISVNAFSLGDEDHDTEDRDEAEGTDEDVNVNGSSGEETDDEYLNANPESNQMKPQPSKIKPTREPIKQPCILIFDSLAGASRARIIATLRDYLRIEYKVKHGEDRDFSKNVVRGAVPKVPQQDNFTDCGLYVLQYVETFFEKKIEDYHLPIKALRFWFERELVNRKRYNIQQLLLQLMQEQNIDIDGLHLPNLHLSSHPSDESDLDDDYVEDEYYDDEEEYYQYECGDIDMESLPMQHHYRRLPLNEDSDEGEYIDEDELEMNRRYEMYDTDDEEMATHDAEADSDEDNSEDDLYKDLDEDAMKTKKFRRNIRRRIANMENNDEEELEDEEAAEHHLSTEVEERIGNSGLSRESVSICRLTSTVSRAHPSASDTRPSSSSTPANTLAELKAARPFFQIDSSGDGCSSKKKFKPN